jgi:NAD(P)H-hydrate epimerase
MLVVTAEQMRELDRLTIERFNVPSLTLMERAGAAVVEAIVKRYRRAAKRGVLIVAGKGNNGGDGLVVARLLKKKRIACEVALLARPEELSADARQNLRALIKLKGRVTEVGAGRLDLLDARLSRNGLLVDAILGTGVKNEVRGLLADAITSMNASGLPIVAIDLPSGLDSDRGVPLGATIQATMTVALGHAKLGEVIHPGMVHAGELVVADIGIDRRALDQVAPQSELLEPDMVRQLVPRRRADTHKGSYGHLLVVAGSRGKTGAAVLACRAAMRCGSGLVTLAAPRSLNNILATSLVEVMTEFLGGEEQGGLEAPSDAEWALLLERKNALLFGPGIGVSDATQNTLRWLVRNLDMPWVIDADGLNNLALEPNRLRHAKTAPILTPHPGEMARLIGRDIQTVQADRIGIARSFAVEHRCHLVLKGARTVIASPEGKVFINPTGNPGMASAGMGDVLAGMLAALLGQGLPAGDAMKLGVYLHGFVGDRVAGANGEIGLIASDIIDNLPAGMRALAG